MLDRSRPYDQVYGISGAHWMQDGRLFDHSGRPIGEDSGVAAPLFDEAEEPQEAGPVPLERLHWKTLKVMVTQYGGEFTTREAAIAFLRGRE